METPVEAAARDEKAGLEGPTARRARVGRFRTLRGYGVGDKSAEGCAGLRRSLTVWSAEGDAGRVFHLVVKTAPGLEKVERERRWLLRGISIREACAGIQNSEVRMLILRDELEQPVVRSIHDGAQIQATYIMPRLSMGKLGLLMRSWQIDKPTITIVDGIGGIIAPPKCWVDGPKPHQWWTIGKHLCTMLTLMQQGLDLQPFPQPIALVVLMADSTYEGLSDEYRDALAGMFPLTFAR